MKKLTQYILIIAVLVGVFSPLAYAQLSNSNAPGTCSRNGGVIVNPLTNQVMVFNNGIDCEKMGGTWTANPRYVPPGSGSTTTPPPPSSTSAPNGACYYHVNAYHAEGSSAGGLSQQQCAFNSPGTYWSVDGGKTIWNPAPASTPTSQSKSIPLVPTDPKYTLLSPLPCEKGTTYCDANGQLTVFDPTSSDGPNKLGVYLNIMLHIFIGVCAVLAVIMITIGGIEYMTSELISSKESGKDKIKGALLGLLLALGAYTLLNTINPDLLKTDLATLKVAQVSVKDFPISGAQSIDGKPGATVNFKTEACPAAAAAEGATGVDKALILSIFAQESSGGVFVGGCSSDGSPNSNGQTANMSPADGPKLQAILTSIGKTPPVNVSCAGNGGHGGAMGGMQILPSTWIEAGGAGKNPWITGDAMGVAAKYISGITDPYQAACKYFGACSFGGVDYARQVVDRMTGIKAQIEKEGC